MLAAIRLAKSHRENFQRLIGKVTVPSGVEGTYANPYRAPYAFQDNSLSAGFAFTVNQYRAGGVDDTKDGIFAISILGNGFIATRNGRVGDRYYP